MSVLEYKADNKIVFGSKSQPFFELAPQYASSFEFVNREWKSLMHFFIIMSVPDIIDQEGLDDIWNLSKLIPEAKRRGFKGICVNDKSIFLRGIYEAFRQDKRRGMILVSTGSAELIYNAPKSFLSENNRYGKILMKYRGEIEKEL